MMKSIESRILITFPTDISHFRVASLLKRKLTFDIDIDIKAINLHYSHLPYLFL